MDKMHYWIGILFLIFFIGFFFMEWRWPGSGPFAYSLKNKCLKKYWKYHPNITVNGYELLSMVHSIMDQFQTPFWLSEGTALGFRRSKEFIPWDDDIDIGVWIDKIPHWENIVQTFVSKGFQLAESKRGGAFVSFIWKQTVLDIDGTGPGRICVANYGACDELIPYLQQLNSIEIKGKNYSIPNDAYFSYLYGADWKTPIPQRKPTLKTDWWRFL